MSAAETFTVNGFTVKLIHDEDRPSPRDEEFHGCDMVLDHRHYTLPNDAALSLADFSGWDAVAAHLTAEGALAVQPVWAYEHGGIALTTGERTYPFTDRWDSGQLGVAYITPANWAEAEGHPWTGSDADRRRAAAVIAVAVDEYGKYLNGECFGYEVTDPADGEVVAESWGLIGYEYAEQAGREAAEGCAHEVKCTGRLDRRAGEIRHDGPCPLHDREGTAT